MLLRVAQAKSGQIGEIYYLLSLLRRLAVFAVARPTGRAGPAPLLPPAGLPSFSSPTLPPFLDWDFYFRDTSVGTNGFPSHAWVIFPLR